MLNSFFWTTCNQQYKTSYSSKRKQSLSFSKLPKEGRVIGACNKLASWPKKDNRRALLGDVKINCRIAICIASRWPIAL